MWYTCACKIIFFIIMHHAVRTLNLPVKTVYSDVTCGYALRPNWGTKLAVNIPVTDDCVRSSRFSVISFGYGCSGKWHIPWPVGRGERTLVIPKRRAAQRHVRFLQIKRSREPRDSGLPTTTNDLQILESNKWSFESDRCLIHLIIARRYFFQLDR